MKHLLKHKFYGKILYFLKYKRHKKIKTFLSKKKFGFKSLFQTSLGSRLKKRQYILKKPTEFFVSQKGIDSFGSFPSKILDKKKYKINSFLFNLLCQFSLSRSHNLFGHDILLRFNTIPYRLSLSHFIGHKILRSYYINLTSSSLRLLRKKILLQAKRSSKDFLPHVGGYPIKKEITKNLLINLETRLDSSLLRLLHFKSLYTKKINLIDNSTNLRTDSMRQHKTVKIKSPWKNFSFLQIKQKINHGLILINGKRVTCSNYRLKNTDQITLKGFISNNSLVVPQEVPANKGIPQEVPANKGIPQEVPANKGIPSTFFFRNSTHFHSDFKRFLARNNSQLDSSLNFYDLIFKSKTVEALPSTFLSQFSTYIKHFKIKRYSEIFYITYKNFFLLSNSGGSSFFNKTCFTSLERFNNLKFYFQTIGFNQSIYFLWPLISLLSLHSWNTEIKNTIVRSMYTMQLAQTPRNGFRVQANSSLIINQQKNLKHLLHLKNLLQKTQLSSTPQRGNGVNHLLNNSIVLSKNKFNWIFAPSSSRSRFSRNKDGLNKNCYAYLLYGTRQCKWIHLQQHTKGKPIFSNKLFNKLNFFDLELDFFQLVFRHYKSNSA